MQNKLKIAFDLDGVIVDKPPLVPKSFLEWLFRGPKKNVLHYRFPKTKPEQEIRKFSHFYLFRPPIRTNIRFIDRLAKNKKVELYVISGRYSFLKSATEQWLRKRKVNKYFKAIYLNLNDEQPHLFKERLLKKMKMDIFVDDDDLLVNYLSQKVDNTKIYCLSFGKDLWQKAENIDFFDELLA